MAGYEWYKTGSVVLRNGDKEVIGANTEWLVNDIKTGDIFIVGTQLYEIAEVIGNTSLKLTKPYEGISDGASEYAIITRAGEVLQAEIALKIQQAIFKWNEIEARTDFLEGIQGLSLDFTGDLSQYDATTSSSSTLLTSLPIASRTQLGGVRIGSNIDVTSDGTISADVDKELIQESFDKVATSPEDMNAMMDEVFSGSASGS